MYLKTINIVLKANNQGMAEALRDLCLRAQTSEVEVKVLRSQSGDITEGDIFSVSSSGAVLIGFNVQIQGRGRQLAKQNKIEIPIFYVIYEVQDYLDKLIKAQAEPVFEEVQTGEAEVRQIFTIGKVSIAGCRVTSGKIKRNSSCRLVRNNKPVIQGHIDGLRRLKDDVKEVAEGFECGIIIDSAIPVVGDKILTFEMRQIT